MVNDGEKEADLSMRFRTGPKKQKALSRNRRGLGNTH
jgi:hypothetical protein